MIVVASISLPGLAAWDARASLVSLALSGPLATIVFLGTLTPIAYYARLAVVHGLDPYVHKPLEAPLDPVYPHVTWTGVTSAYGPLFTLATYPLAWLPVWWAVAALKAVAPGAVVYAEIPGAQHAFEIFPSLRTAFVVHGVERFLALIYSRYLDERGIREDRAAVG